jgi:sec-independent protein translocase protein TatB
MEMLVLAIVAVVVVGPERLPKLARDAAQLIRSLREMATGAREQLRDELGPEFADVDLRNLNPRTALTRAVFGDEDDLESLRKLDPRRWDARGAAHQALFGDDDAPSAAADAAADSYGARGSGRVDLGKAPSANGAANESAADGAPRPRPRPRPAAPATPYDDDAT